jgi:two-component system, OmpR family, alkaline phosphatase synthesis response regulator PhoP
VKKKILIVDDQEDIVKLLEMRLSTSGYDFISAEDGEAGLKLARSEKPDLIIMDIMMPKMDGYKVCGLLKNDARFAHIPVILFTAKALDEDRRIGEEVKADAFIVKPYNAQILIEKVKELIGD